MTTDDDFARAVALHREGRVGDAEAVCQAILEEAPEQPRALHLLGVIWFSAGRTAAAIGLLERAVAAKPDYAEAEFNLGIMLAAAGRMDAAAVHFGRAATLRPDHIEAHLRLGAALLAIERFAEAEDAFGRALALRPDDGLILADLAAVTIEQGKIEAAIGYGRRAVEQAPDIPEAHLRLGRALNAQGARDDAMMHFRNALALDPQSAAAANALTAALCEHQDLDAAEALARKTLSDHPDNPTAAGNLALIAVVKGESKTAVELYRRAIGLAPDRPEIRRSLLLALLYEPGLTAPERFAAQEAFAKAVTIRVERTLPPPTNDRDPNRTLRIGWLSSDFRNHPVARNLELLLLHRDRAHFEMFGYADVVRPDAVTDWFRGQMETWRSVAGWSDDAVAAQIRSDRIDVMIYLAGRFDRNRPQVAAWRPAPVQVSLFDAATSGLGAMDYLMADAMTVPKHPDERFTEHVLRLPNLFVQPPIEWAPAVVSPPCRTRGHVSFASFNNPAKLNRQVAAVWGDILRRVPGSRLYLTYRRTFASQGLRERVLRDLGADVADRVDFDDTDRSMKDHLRRYESVDISLDPFPFTGSTTTFEALWMGVPVVTLLGANMVGRLSASMLHAVKLDELIARTPEDYVTMAVALANDPRRLTDLRHGLRARVAKSPLCDGAAQTRHVERLYRAMWRRWCKAA